MRFKILKQGGYGSGGISDMGGNMSGPLVLMGNPTQSLEAATKGYVDTALGNLNAANLTTGLIPVERLPAFTGDVTNVAGSNVFTLSDTGVSPSSYPRVTVNAKGRITNGYLLSESDLPELDWGKITAGKPTTMAGYGVTDAVAPAGGDMAGVLKIARTPTSPLHAVPKSYVDALSQGNANGTYKTGDLARKATATTPAGFLRANGGEVSRELYSALFEVMKDTYGIKVTVDYTLYNAMGSGQPWRDQYNFKNSGVSTVTFGAAGNILRATSASQAIVTKNRVYLFSPETIYVAVQTAAINEDGTLGAWSNVPATINVESYYITGFVTKNRAHLVIGASSGNGGSAYSAPINVDGTLGTWVRDAVITGYLISPTSFVTKNRVYVFVANSGYDHYTAAINADGTLGAWSKLARSVVGPTASIYDMSIFSTKNRVYIHSSDGSFTALINDDGTLGKFVNVGLTGLYWNNGYPIGQKFYVTKNRVWCFGGFNQYDNTVLGVTFSAPINADGTVGTFTIGNNLPSYKFNAELIATKNRIYLLGGISSTQSNSENSEGPGTAILMATLSGDQAMNDYTMFTNGTINKFDGSNITGEITVRNDYPEGDNTWPGSGQAWQQQNKFNTTQTGALPSWASTPDLPIEISEATVIVTKNYVYLMGGLQRQEAPTIWRSSIDDTGQIGAWTQMPNSLIHQARSGHAVVLKNRVYVIGGYTTNVVQHASINADGTLGVFSVVGELPLTIANAAVVVTKNRLYLIGGDRSVGSVAMLYAPINTDGTLGTWISVPLNLPTSPRRGQAVIINNRVYLIGVTGLSSQGTGTSLESNVYWAPIFDDGSIGNFTVGQSLPAQVADSKTIVTKNRVYVVGGRVNDIETNIVYSAVVNSDDSLGTWNAESNVLPMSISRHVLFATKSYLYALGGCYYLASENVTYQSRKGLFTNFTGGLNDYSKYYDGTLVPAAAGVFRLPDYTAKELPGSYTYIKT